MSSRLPLVTWPLCSSAPARRAWVSRSRDIDRANVVECAHQLGGVLGAQIGLIDPGRAEAGFVALICAVEEKGYCYDLRTPLVNQARRGSSSRRNAFWAPSVDRGRRVLSRFNGSAGALWLGLRSAAIRRGKPLCLARLEHHHTTIH